MSRGLIGLCLLLGTVAVCSSMDETTATAENTERGAGGLPRPQGTNSNPPLDARDCSVYYNSERRESSVNVIRPNGVKDCFPVYCETERDGGGWTGATVERTAVNQEKGPGCYSNSRGTTINPPPDARDCSDYYNLGRRESGVYVIRPSGFKNYFLVYCEMEKDGGGWTVIQRQGNYGLPDDYFYKNWTEYKQGFGYLELEFWLGNDKISALTKQGKYQLKVDLIDVDQKHYEYTYGVFKVEGEIELYRLSTGESSDNSTFDKLLYHNGMRFSTYDRDNDMWSGNCAGLKDHYGGWWYNDCAYVFLNSFKSSDQAINQFYIHRPTRVHLLYSQLMIRK